jgi:hypothetical protein
MAKKIPVRIKRPNGGERPAEIFIDYPGAGPVWPTFVAAYGRANQVGEVIGIITARDGTVLNVGHTLAQAPNWVIYFRDLPPHAELTLLVFESPRIGRSCVPVYATADFTTGAVPDRGEVDISAPGTGAHVSSTFSSCGTSDVSGVVIANFEGGAGQYSGTVLQGAPNWVVQFSNVQPSLQPDGTTYPYTLNVIVGGTPARNPSSNILVP